jgi:murein DD-endopeptidase MepM/ murein hydrolase activator NlpD
MRGWFRDHAPQRWGKLHDQPTGKRKLILGLCALALAVVLPSWLLTGKGSEESDVIPKKEGPLPASSSTPSGAVPVFLEVDPSYLEDLPLDETVFRVRRSAKLRDGDTIFQLFRSVGIPPREIHELARACRAIRDLGRLRAGANVMVEYDQRDGRILYFRLDMEGEQFLEAVRQAGRFRVSMKTLPYTVKHRVLEGTINGSLFLAAQDAGLSTPLILELAEIFAWDIDFNMDIRRGDRFRVLFEEKHLQGSSIRPGRILAAQIINRGKTFQAFYYQQRNGWADYYDEMGRSLRKVFLRSPLKYTRISSIYSRRRLHPILKIQRPHLGVDYAAPMGTPVRAVGDGVVVFAGWKGAYGRFVKIRHNAVYTTTYGHLSRFARGLRRGKTVRQGQIIGYVGRSGLATGPHLDFRMLKNGRYVNPLKVKFPRANPVPKGQMQSFKEMVRIFMCRLEGCDLPVASPILPPPVTAKGASNP